MHPNLEEKGVVSEVTLDPEASGPAPERVASPRVQDSMWKCPPRSDGLQSPVCPLPSETDRVCPLPVRLLSAHILLYELRVASHNDFSSVYLLYLLKLLVFWLFLCLVKLF